ncbi:hypothetical protein FNV43_RR04337 [Rhamnella rubrinervis]|uniref:Uncharacterized protein n=1 Tax=Rhamnella rubrinervis TaxID=2594499 RepID=A0A8K0HK13_9ROSA|nr:hypothetical protein FNV43_RR04337 [Rhamnella rubrinervis]
MKRSMGVPRIRKPRMNNPVIFTVAEEKEMNGVCNSGSSNGKLGNDAKGQLDPDPTEELCRQVYLVRFVSNTIGRGIARDELENEMEDRIEVKDIEIAQLWDKLNNYEAINKEMVQKNQDVICEAYVLCAEMLWQDRERRKRRQRWVWGLIIATLTVGTAALAWSYLPSSGTGSSTSDFERPQSDDAGKFRSGPKLGEMGSVNPVEGRRRHKRRRLSAGSGVRVDLLVAGPHLCPGPCGLGWWKDLKNYLSREEMNVEAIVRLELKKTAGVEEIFIISEVKANVIEHGPSSKSKKNSKGFNLGPKGGISKAKFQGKCLASDRWVRRL